VSAATIVEAVAVGFSLAAVILTVRKNVLCWPAGLVGVTAYLWIFREIRLYADMGLQVVFFAQGVYGWYFWLRGGEDHTPAPVRRLGVRGLATTMITLALATVVLGGALSRWTNASLPYLDSLLAVTSLTANMLLARKVLESWILWIGADALYVGMFVVKGIYLTAALYVVFLGLASAGLWRWLAEERGRVG
jgi:nicotinamide mononucleotide transporter